MPKLIPEHTVILHRDGKRLVPKIGKPFQFTAEEVASINAVNPSALTAPQVDAEEADESPAENKGGKKKPTAPGAKSAGDEDL